MSFAERLNEALELLGWNQTDLGTAGILGTSTVSHVCTGKTAPALVTALTISEVTGWTLDSLTGDAGLLEPDFIRLVRPLHVATTEWCPSMRWMCERFTTRVIAERLGVHTTTVLQYGVRGAEPRLTTAIRYATALGQSLHAMAAGQPLRETLP
jgi:hypothetical protein